MTHIKGSAKPKFAVGDKVREKERQGVVVATPRASELMGRFKDVRVGEVKAVTVKKDKRGHLYFYYEVLWDYLKTPTTHHQMRLVLFDGSSE